MSLFVRQMKFGQFYIHNKYRLINLWTTAHNNLISDSNNINKKNYSCYADLLLPDNVIKKYLNTIVTAYVSKDKTNDEFASIMQIQDVVNLLENRLQIDENIKSLKELGEQDEEMQKLGQEEYTGYQNHLTQLDENLIDIILNNTGRDDCKDIIFDITAGFNHDLIEANTESGTGGLRHASFIVSGVGAFELLRHEGGVHRVQRVPSTEKSGRIHTSTASVVVLPQPSEIEVNLLDKDLRIETKRSSGAGGQSVNKTESAVRIVHLPTGIAVEAQSERTQVRNKQLALLKLRTQIYDKQLNEQKSVAGSFRKKQRGMCQRNEKVRTYNYNQDRITDHRLANGTFHNLKNFMEGGEVLENLQKQLQMNFQLQLLRELIENCK